MPCANTLGETPIPAPEPPAAPQPLSAEDVARATAALMRLIALAIYIEIMRLLGYRVRRPRNRPKIPQPRPTPTAKPAPATPAPPRPVYRYIDRDMCLGILAGISADMPPIPQPPAEPPTAAPVPSLAPLRPRCRRPGPPRLAAPRSALNLPFARPSPRPHPPPRSKTRLDAVTNARPFHYEIKTFTRDTRQIT